MSLNSSSEPTYEPDLTPLLDLVLQLVMFFMLVVHFETEQRNENVQLPRAGIATGIVKKDRQRVLFINVLPVINPQTNRPSRTNATITVFEGTSMKEYTNQEQLKLYLSTEFQKDQAATKPAEWESGAGRSVVVLRGDKDVPFKFIYDTFMSARSVGYASIQLRAQVDRTSGG